MGIGSKLIMAFVIVIAVMVTGYSFFSIYSDFRTDRLQAGIRLQKAFKKLDRDKDFLKAACDTFASIAQQDKAMMSAFVNKDRKALADSIDALTRREHFPGFITLIEPDGKVFYSSEARDKHGYSATEHCPMVKLVLDQKYRYSGYTDFSVTRTVTLSTLVPIIQDGKTFRGLLAVSQPLSNEYLIGEVTKFALEEPEPVRDIDLMVYFNSSKRIGSISPGLGGGAIKDFARDLSQKSLAAVPGETFAPIPDFITSILISIPSPPDIHIFEREGRLWYKIPLPGIKQEGKPDTVYGVLFVATPVENVWGKLIGALLVSGLFGVIAFAIGLFLSRRISRSVVEPLHFLIDRTEDIAERRRHIPPLEGLSGEWLELGELIDTAVSTMRSSTQSLKIKLSKQKEELEEKAKQMETSSYKLENLNKQITTQSRQLGEVSKQINQAKKQAVVVQHKLDAVLQSSTEGFLILDQYGNILSANPIFLNWIGVSEGEIAGRLCFDLVRKPDEGRPSFQSGEAFATHGGDNQLVLNRFHPEGIVYHAKEDKRIEVLLHLQPISGEDNSIRGYVMVLRDKSLRSENAQLRQEIVIMLQDSIRQELATGEGHWRAILSNAGSSMSPQTLDSLKDLHGIYENLVSVVDSYLMMYGGFVPPPIIAREPIVITRLVADCLEEVTPLAKQRQLLLQHKTMSGLPSINGNRDAVKGILIEVLNKMISVTAPGGRVRVESIIRGDEMRITVTSSGPALPQEEIIEMFEGFIEGRHAQDTYSDRLSMYLARNNVERLGGQIWAESEAGRGTAIHFVLPAIN